MRGVIVVLFGRTVLVAGFTSGIVALVSWYKGYLNCSFQGSWNTSNQSEGPIWANISGDVVVRLLGFFFSVSKKYSRDTVFSASSGDKRRVSLSSNFGGSIADCFVEFLSFPLGLHSTAFRGCSQVWKNAMEAEMWCSGLVNVSWLQSINL